MRPCVHLLRTVGLPVLAGLLPHSALAACPSTTEDVNSATSAAMTAYSQMQDAQFDAAMTEARAALACLSEAMNPAVAAAWHRAEALAAFASQDHDRAAAEFKTALTLQPAYVLPTSIAPAGNPLEKLYLQAKNTLPCATEALPTGSTFLVDGRLQSVRPTDCPVLLQQQAPDGAIAATTYLAAGAPLPDWARPVAVLPPEPLPRHLLWGTGAAAVATGALYVAALVSANAWERTAHDCASADGCTVDPTLTLGDVDGRRTRANVLSAAAVAGGVATTGLGVAALITIAW